MSVCVFQSTTSGNNWGLWRLKITKSCPWGPDAWQPSQRHTCVGVNWMRGFFFLSWAAYSRSQGITRRLPRLFSSAQLLSRVRLCDPKDCSTPGFSVHHQLPEFIQTHVHWVGWLMPSNHLILCRPLLLSPSQALAGEKQIQGQERARAARMWGQDWAQLHLTPRQRPGFCSLATRLPGRALPPWVFPQRPSTSRALASRAGRATGARRNTAQSPCVEPTAPNWVPPKTQPSQRAGKGRMYYWHLQQVRRTRDLSQSSVSSNSKTGEVLS